MNVLTLNKKGAIMTIICPYPQDPMSTLIKIIIILLKKKLK